MAMISDPDYILQAIRLSALRTTDDSLTPRIISLDPSFSLNPYITASGLSDVDRWPEIKRALDSPPLDPIDRPQRRPSDERGGTSGGRGLNYTQTIMGGRSGALGMRVTGRSRAEKREGRANSSSAGGPPSPIAEKTPKSRGVPTTDGFFSPSGRPRADSAPIPQVLEPSMSGTSVGTSVITTGRGMRSGIAGSGLLEAALSASDISGEIEEEGEDGMTTDLDTGMYDDPSTAMGMSARPSDLGPDSGDVAGALGQTMMDEGSDVDEDEIEEEGDGYDDTREYQDPGAPSNRTSMYPDDTEELDFAPITIPPRHSVSAPSGLTALLNRHVPHLVSTSSAPEAEPALNNPFASLYASAAALSNIPSISLELYFPHSEQPTKALVVKVRKDSTVEEVTGYGLFRFWEDQWHPLLSEQESAQRWSTVGWGLRIVEDDGEVDEDFPPLDRDSAISKFSYGQFAIVEATEAQTKQNTAKAPHIQRRPSRVIAPPVRTRPSQQGRPSFTTPQPTAAAAASSSSLSSNEHLNPGLSSAIKGSVGLSSALSNTVLLRVKVTASADVHFTTTISAPADMYIADLTEVLCKKKRLPNGSADWVLCLADLTLALPLDRTVASLEGRTDLALVRRQWAVAHGLRIEGRKGGDPSASIFKRLSEPAPLAKFGAGVADISQTYKKYTVQRKIAIGRHERVLAIDGDYIHIMPSESRAFFDSMKTTSFHVTLVASCKLTGRAGGFKINIWRDAGQKRYEFEADNGRQAAEIVATIRQLMRSYQAERNTVLPPPRPPPALKR